MAQQQKPKPAATVILLRSGGRDPFEIFLTRRPEDMAFLGGMYCFPGGTVRKKDCSRELLERTYGLNPKEARTMIGSHFSPPQAIGFWIAAVRELFEETGILLVIKASGTDQSLDSSRRVEESTLAVSRGAKHERRGPAETIGAIHK